MSIATYEIGESINAEMINAERTITSTRIFAAKMAQHLTGPGHLRRFLHDEDTLLALKKQLVEFDAKQKKWKSLR